MNYKELEKVFIETLDDIYKEVLELGGVDFDNLWNYTEDYVNSSNGSVLGLIYYTDTEPFAKEWHDEINNILEELDCVNHLTLNDKTWLVWKVMMNKLIHFKEEYNEKVDND